MINKFEGKYRFLSNFYEHPVTVDRLTYRNSEAAFHAGKTIYKEQFTNLSASDAKKLGRRINMRYDWDEVKDLWMFHVLMCKFSDNELRQKLMDTGDEELVEGNTWHDNYWGSCTCQTCKNLGKNKLGHLLMIVRSELEKED